MLPNTKIALKTTNTLQNILPRVKDMVDPLQHSNIIYSIPCECNMVYIGMSKNQLKTRLSGHRSNIKVYKTQKDKTQQNQHENNSNHNPVINTETINAQLESPPQIASSIINHQTALIQHMAEYDHMFDLTRTKILDRSYRSSSLGILEMCHITNTPNTVNHRTDVDGLNNVYAGILHSIKVNREKTSRLTPSRLPITPLLSDTG